jgi:hypothetical protein
MLQSMGLQRGVWHPELVDKVHAYPKTAEEFEAKREMSRQAAKERIARGEWMTRKGFTDGWSGKAKELSALRHSAAVKAKKWVNQMAEADQLVHGDDENAKTVMSAAMAIVVAKGDDGKYVESTRDRLQAIRTVLEYTKAKPAQKLEVSKAEDFLLNLAKQS